MNLKLYLGEKSVYLYRAEFGLNRNTKTFMKLKDKYSTNPSVSKALKTHGSGAFQNRPGITYENILHYIKST